MFVGPELNLLMIQWWKRFRSLPVHFSACVHTSQGEKFLIIGLPRVHLLLLNGNVSQGCVWDSSNRRKYYRFNKVLMGAVTRDTFTVVNDPLIRLDKTLSPTGFSRQGFYSLSRRENKHPSNFERSVFGPPLAENRLTPALRICRWLPVFANWKKKENRFLGATKHLFFLACCQILALYRFEGFFPFLLRQQPLTEPKLVPAFLFFSAAKALPLSPAVVVSPTACSSGLDLGSGYCAIFMVSFLERVLCTTERISYFLQESASTFPTVCPFPRFLCCPSCPFPATPWWTVSLFLPRTLLLGIQRHLESPRHETLSRVWRALAALLSWASPLACTRAFLLLWHFFFSPHPHDALCGWKELCRVWCIGVYLARFWAWCQDCVFRPAAEFGEHDFIARHGQDLCHEDWATPEPKDCGHPLLLSTPSLVGLATVPCTLPLYFA